MVVVGFVVDKVVGFAVVVVVVVVVVEDASGSHL